MSNNLVHKGKIAVVTGANRGIGKGIVLELAKQGADIVAVARDKAKLEETAAEIAAMGRRVLTVDADVRDKKRIDEIMDKIVPEFGGVDIFVNNAGVTIRKGVVDITEDEMNRIIDTNFKGAVYFLQGAARQMRKQARGGSIAVVTSVNALYPLPDQAIYTSTKAGLEALVRCLAVELSDDNIRVNSVAPGAVDTDMNPGHSQQKSGKPRHLNLPLKRIGMPDDIAEVVSFVVSDAARYMTGSTILVDGGLMLRYR